MAGVAIAGAGRCVPDGKLTNADLERRVDTTDEWIIQRTGIKERRICDPAKGESTLSLCTGALKQALERARMDASELDLIVLGTVTGETRVPAVACRVAANLEAGHVGAFDLLAGCSGFVYGLNMAHDLIRAGTHRAIGVIGCDVMSSIVDPLDRRTVILFGDAAGACVLRSTDDASKGILAQALHSDGSRWHDLYLPYIDRDLPEGATWQDAAPGVLRMNGREVYKFAVKTFNKLIGETLDQAGLTADDVAIFVTHQSNARIIESARTKFGIPKEKMYVNIDRFGNCSSGSVPVCLSELYEQERIHDGDIIMFAAFGAGLTWASSLWRV
jgi:3-oxoacyl-[acyl-carrier-protein] synthase III